MKINPIKVSNLGRFAIEKNIVQKHDSYPANNISKNENSQFAENQFLFSSYISPNKQVSFKAYSWTHTNDKIPQEWIMHEDGIAERAGVIVDGSYSRFDENSIPYKFPPAIDFINNKENRDKIVPFYSVKSGYIKEFGVNKDVKKLKEDGFLYIHPNGDCTHIPPNCSYIGEKVVDGPLETSLETEKLVDYFHTKENWKMRNYMLEKGKMGHEKTRYIQAHYLIENGREEEAIELHPDMIDFVKYQLSETAKKCSFTVPESPLKDYRRCLADGDYKEAFKFQSELPYNLRNLDRLVSDKIVEFVEDETKFWKYEASLKEHNKYIMQMPSLDANLELSKQEAAFASPSKEGMYLDSLFPKLPINRQLREYRGLITTFIDEILQSLFLYDQRDKAAFQKAFEAEKNKEVVKEELQKKLLFPLYKSKTEPDTVVPNCVMLHGENPIVMKELIEWVAQVSEMNYMKINSQRNMDKMQDNILEALEMAEEQYEETGKRSIIFVNGMDRLLNNSYNSKGNVACLKDMMCNASEDYHSTIMFYSVDPEELDEGATASHRVEVKIKVPVYLEYYDAFLGRKVDKYYDDDDDYYDLDPYHLHI